MFGCLSPFSRSVQDPRPARVEGSRVAGWYSPQSLRAASLLERLRTQHVLAGRSARRPRTGVGNQAGDWAQAMEATPDRLLRLAGDFDFDSFLVHTFRLSDSARR